MSVTMTLRLPRRLDELKIRRRPAKDANWHVRTSKSQMSMHIRTVGYIYGDHGRSLPIKVIIRNCGNVVDAFDWLVINYY